LRPEHFTLTASAETIFFDAALVGFVGPVTVAAVGSPQRR
jgi:hypothetical protein